MLTILTNSSSPCSTSSVSFDERFADKHLSRPMSGQRALFVERVLSHRQATTYLTDQQHAQQASTLRGRQANRNNLNPEPGQGTQQDGG